VNERDIFHAALEIADRAERTAYLEKACAGDAALQAHFEGLLELQPKLGSFLEAPAIDLTASPPLSAGRFQLGPELARGGMGVVYSARDESLGRDVAVKVLHQRYLVDSLVGQRFVDEARITAQLQHPAIPPVFEVGRLGDERPYLAMKLIKGRTLEDLLKERSEPASGRGRFLAVFEQVCQAVGYAHSKHILHRDLKPANVMVGAFGEVQVMDWGLAKLLPPGGGAAHEPAAGTETVGGSVIQTARPSASGTLAGTMLGTPAFMAPEQAGGELDRLDERTDCSGWAPSSASFSPESLPIPGNRGRTSASWRFAENSRTPMPGLTSAGQTPSCWNCAGGACRRSARPARGTPGWWQPRSTTTSPVSRNARGRQSESVRPPRPAPPNSGSAAVSSSPWPPPSFWLWWAASPGRPGDCWGRSTNASWPRRKSEKPRRP
jgi:serine/threonine protein kinase